MSTTTSGTPSFDQIRIHVARVLSSRAFDQAERAKAFLNPIVVRTLEGSTAEIKETVIAVEALSRMAYFRCENRSPRFVKQEFSRGSGRLSHQRCSTVPGEPVSPHRRTGLLSSDRDPARQGNSPGMTVPDTCYGLWRSGTIISVPASPDGQQLAFTNQEPEWTRSVWVMDLNRSQVSHLTQPEQSSSRRPPAS